MKAAAKIFLIGIPVLAAAGFGVWFFVIRPSKKKQDTESDAPASNQGQSHSSPTQTQAPPASPATPTQLTPAMVLGKLAFARYGEVELFRSDEKGNFDVRNGFVKKVKPGELIMRVSIVTPDHANPSRIQSISNGYYATFLNQGIELK